MKRFQKVYLEISNICNLSCQFCPGTKRAPKAMTQAELAVLLSKLQPWTDYLYFHLMGEPLCHPQLETFLQAAKDHGFKVILTTNGTLLKKQKHMLLSSPALHKVNISLHAFEANDLSIPLKPIFSSVFPSEKLPKIRNWLSSGSGIREVPKKRMQKFSEKWSVTSPDPGCRSGKEPALETAFIWNTATSLTGRI